MQCTSAVLLSVAGQALQHFSSQNDKIFEKNVTEKNDAVKKKRMCGLVTQKRAPPLFSQVYGRPLSLQISFYRYL